MKQNLKINAKIAQIKEALEAASTVDGVIQVISKYGGVVTSKYNFKKGRKNFKDGEIAFKYGASTSDYATFGEITYRSKGSLFAPSYQCGVAADSYRLRDETINLILGVF